MEAIDDVKKAIAGIGTAFAEFKQTHEQQIAEIKKNGVADPLTKEHLAKLNDAISANQAVKDRIDKLEVAMKRAGAQTRRVQVNGEEQDAPEDWAEAKASYNAFLRKGANSNRGNGGDEWRYEAKTLSTQSDPDGGFLVTSDMNGRVIKKVFETSPIRTVASVQAVSSDALEGTFDDDEATASWVSESGSRSSTANPKIGKWRIPVFELYAMPAATQRLLDDANINIETWLADKVADKFARTENTAFVNGTGVGQPRGFLTYPSGTTLRSTIEQTASGSSAALVADKLHAHVYSLKEVYRRQAQWGMSRTTMGLARQLKDSFGQYYWQPNYQAGQPATLLGYPVNEFNDMPDPASNSLSVAFADWAEAYQIVDRIGLRVLRDPYTSKGFVLFYTTKRTGGDVLNTEAIKIHKLG